MAEICPAILADTTEDFSRQIERVVEFAPRIQIDLTDGIFAQHKTIGLEEAWWPAGLRADIHLMYQKPKEAVEFLVQHQPNLLIVHAEADYDLKALSKLCERHEVKIGLAILPATSALEVLDRLQKCQHALIFSGHLGEFGGHADFSLLDKVKQIRSSLPDIEIGWDGGVNDQNVADLVYGGVDVLNVGGFLQHSPEPARTFQALERIADETGTT